MTLSCQVLEELQLRFTADVVDLTMQVLDTVTEFVQGPCQPNQFAIVNLKVCVAPCVLVCSFFDEVC